MTIEETEEDPKATMMEIAANAGGITNRHQIADQEDDAMQIEPTKKKRRKRKKKMTMIIRPPPQLVRTHNTIDIDATMITQDATMIDTQTTIQKKKRRKRKKKKPPKSPIQYIYLHNTVTNLQDGQTLIHDNTTTTRFNPNRQVTTATRNRCKRKQKKPNPNSDPPPPLEFSYWKEENTVIPIRLTNPYMFSTYQCPITYYTNPPPPPQPHPLCMFYPPGCST